MAGLVKHYQNSMKGIPQLTNNWGAMITLLDAVLITGFNHVPVLGLTKSSATAITATINLGSGHGFIDRQVIRIAGSTNGWDGDYKILSADANAINIECTAENLSMITGAATCFASPLDFEIVYQTVAGSSTPKRAYRSKDPESLGLILLVHDFCNAGASATGAKFAKVGVVSSMSDIDNITGVQMPLDPSKPNANWEWDGVNHGWTKWYYRTTGGSDYFADSTTASNGNSNFNLAGDNKSFALDVAHSNNIAFAIYCFCEFFDNKLNGNNLALLAFGAQARVSQNYQYLYSWARGGYHLANEAGSEAVGGAGLKLNGLIWFDEAGVSNSTKMGRNLTFGTMDQDHHYNYINLDIFAALPILDSSDKPRGIVPFIRISAKQESKSGVSSIGKYVTRYGSASANTKYVKYALMLESS